MGDRTAELYQEDFGPEQKGNTMTRREFLKKVSEYGKNFAKASPALILLPGLGKEKAGDDGVGKVFRIDGIPDPSYKMDTPVNTAYAFIDLVKANDLKKLYEIMGGKEHVLGMEDGKPLTVNSKEFKFYANLKRKDYAGLKSIKIEKIEYNKQGDMCGVYFNVRGKPQFVILCKDGNKWYAPKANFGLLSENY